MPVVRCMVVSMLETGSAAKVGGAPTPPRQQASAHAPVYKWLARLRAGGERMLRDRSSAPARPRQALAAETLASIERLRRARMTGQAIADRLGLARSTVGAVLRRLGLGRLDSLNVKPPILRYERERPGG